MRTVHLADKDGNLKEKYIGFSFAFLFFGPFYLFAKVKVISGLVLLLLYYYFLPIPGMESLVKLFTYNMAEEFALPLSRFLLFFRNDYPKYLGITIVVVIQIFIASIIEGKLISKSIKKGKLLPITEDDARLLIYIHACNRKVQLASNTFNTNDSTPKEDDLLAISNQKDVPFIINDNKNDIQKFKQSEKTKKIDELNDFYRLGQITREEYELRRARIINQYK